MVEQWSEESQGPRFAKLLRDSRLIPKFSDETPWSKRPIVLSAAGRPHLSCFTSPLKEVDEWVERYRVIWEQRLDRINEYLKPLQVKEKRLAAWDS